MRSTAANTVCVNDLHEDRGGPAGSTALALNPVILNDGVGGFEFPLAAQIIK